MERLSIPDDVKKDIVWVEYSVCKNKDWWLIEGIAELKIKWEKN